MEPSPDSASASASRPATAAAPSAPTTFSLGSDAFQDGGAIPQEHTCDGADHSPPISWNVPPEGTQSLALIMHDPDASSGDYTHWVLFDLPADTTSLETDLPAAAETPIGARQGRNDFGRLGYGGPCPPAGPAHRYVLDLYALEAPLGLPAGATRADVEAAIRSAGVLARATLTGRYGREGQAG
jgi:Raf kinase inhibitor-like YbhB/YbcL family protein